MTKNVEAQVVEPEVEEEEENALQLDSVATGNGDGGESDLAHVDGERLRDALDALEGKVKFLLARYSLLAQRVVSAVAARGEAEEKLARLSTGGLDMASLEDRNRILEAENQRLSRHAAYLEDRIANLLARVRYAVKS